MDYSWHSEVGQAKTCHCDYFTNHVKPLTSMFLNPTDPAEICTVISHLRGNNSPGHDDISTKQGCKVCSTVYF